MGITAEQMGVIIREQRKSKNLTQQDLAQAAGVSVQAVSKWEVGQSLPDVALLPDIADCLGLSLEALFGRAAREESPLLKVHVTDVTDMVTDLFGSTAREESMGKAVAFEGFPDDGKLRVAQFLGSRPLRADEQREDTPPIPLAIEEALKNGLTEDMLRRLNLRVEILGSARIEGSVQGDVSAGGRVECTGDIQGDASAGGGVSCEGDIQGDASAGGGLSCGNDIQGDASSGGSLTCKGDIQGDASSGGSLTCKGDIQGDATAGTSLACEGNIEGDAESKGDLKCGGDIGGDATAGGDLICGGGVEGDVHMGGRAFTGGEAGNTMGFKGRFSSRDRSMGGMAHDIVSSVLKSVGIIPDGPTETAEGEPADDQAGETPDGGEN